jgi:hypothetical protein
MEIEEEKVWSVYKDKKGHEYAGNLKSYILKAYPNLNDLRAKPEYSTKTRSTSPLVKNQIILPKNVPVKEGEKFDRAFAMNPNIRFDTVALDDLAKKIVFCTDFPVHDSLTGEKSRSRYELVISQRLKDFNSLRDVIAIYGDPVVLTMAIFYLASKQVKSFKVARFSNRDNMYHVREISINDFV